MDAVEADSRRGSSCSSYSFLTGDGGEVTPGDWPLSPYSALREGGKMALVSSTSSNRSNERRNGTHLAWLMSLPPRTTLGLFLTYVSVQLRVRGDGELDLEGAELRRRETGTHWMALRAHSLQSPPSLSALSHLTRLSRHESHALQERTRTVSGCSTRSWKQRASQTRGGRPSPRADPPAASDRRIRGRGRDGDAHELLALLLGVAVLVELLLARCTALGPLLAPCAAAAAAAHSSRVFSSERRAGGPIDGRRRRLVARARAAHARRSGGHGEWWCGRRREDGGPARVPWRGRGRRWNGDGDRR